MDKRSIMVKKSKWLFSRFFMKFSIKVISELIMNCVIKFKLSIWWCREFSVYIFKYLKQKTFSFIWTGFFILVACLGSLPWYTFHCLRFTINRFWKMYNVMNNTYSNNIRWNPGLPFGIVSPFIQTRLWECSNYF